MVASAGDLANIQPQGAAALDGQPAWLVGLPMAESGVQQPQIAAWRNGAWSSVSQPFSGYGSLNAVDALSPDAAWAVGSVGRPVGRAVAAHWDGVAWNKVRSPSVGGSPATFSDVAAVSYARAWAVGARLRNGRREPLAYFWSGSRWLNRTPGIAVGVEGGLTAVDRAPDGRIWVAGWLADDGVPRPWLLTRVNGGWRPQALDTVEPGAGVVTDVVFTGSADGWLVGYVEPAGGGLAPIIQHWDGSRWRTASAPLSASAPAVIRAVSVDPHGQVIVAGTVLAEDERRGILATLTGGSWKLTEVEGGEWRSGTWLQAVAALEGGALAVGVVKGRAAHLESCPEGMTPAGRSTSAPSTTRDGASTETGEDLQMAAEPDIGEAQAVPVSIAGIAASDRTAAAGLTMSISTYEGNVADFNGDGYPDIFINRHIGDVPLLMLGSATGEFAELAFPWTWADRHGCDAADVDLDGALDLFCSGGGGRGAWVRSHGLLLHPGSGERVAATAAFGLIDPFARGYQATFLNLDGDPFPDLYVSSEPARVDAFPSVNRLFRNVAGTHFEIRADAAANRSFGGESVVAEDLDHDGDDDLIVASTVASDGLKMGVRVLFNRGGHFVDLTSDLGITPMAEVDVAVADFNADGLPDIAQLGSRMLRVMLNDGERFTASFDFALQCATAMAVGDVNADGRPDIYVSQETGDSDAHAMLVNDGAGVAFTALAIPASSGSANDVLAIDYDGNGMTDFITLNGRYAPGPLQLIAFFAQ